MLQASSRDLQEFIANPRVPVATEFERLAREWQSLLEFTRIFDDVFCKLLHFPVVVLQQLGAEDQRSAFAEGRPALVARDALCESVAREPLQRSRVGSRPAFWTSLHRVEQLAGRQIQLRQQNERHNQPQNIRLHPTRQTTKSSSRQKPDQLDPVQSRNLEHLLVEF